MHSRAPCWTVSRIISDDRNYVFESVVIILYTLVTELKIPINIISKDPKLFWCRRPLWLRGAPFSR